MKKKPVIKIENIKVIGAIDMSNPAGRQYSMFETKGFVNFKNKKK